MQSLRCFQHLFGRCPDAQVFRQVDPSHYTRGVEQELGRASDIVAVHACTDMQKVVALDHLGLGIGKKCVGVAGLSAQVSGHAGSVYAYSHRPNALIRES
jgi:hypothetical protein